MPLSPLCQILGSNPYWDFFRHRFFVQSAASLHLSFYSIFPNVFYFFFAWCVFHNNVWLSKKTEEFHANCSIHFILIVLILSSPVARQLLRLCLISSVTSARRSFFSALYFQSSIFLFVLCVFILSVFISAKADSSFLTSFTLSCNRLTHGGVSDFVFLIYIFQFLLFLTEQSSVLHKRGGLP